MAKPAVRTSRVTLAGAVSALSLLAAIALNAGEQANAADVEASGSPKHADAGELATTLADDTYAANNGPDLGSGIASYYGVRFAGKPTASGEPFDPAGLTAAHPSLPFGSKVLVTNELNGQSVVVTINDRGPFHGERIIDLSRAAASRIGLVSRGKGPVSLALLTE